MKYLIPDHVLEERIGEEIVLLSLKRETFFSLNASGIYLWSEMKEGRSPDELCAGLAQVYGLDPGQARTDLQKFAAELEKLELVTLAAD
jgi:hypothetical protein